MQFEDFPDVSDIVIRITHPDVDLTQPSQQAPGFRRVYLKLSAPKLKFD
jgi:hypothetical protein